jgi:uncharacterized protein YndB with AHSA1/START domain
MSDAKPAQEKRTVVKEIEVAAPVETVWKALTDGTELARWFPLEASVEPGVGGKMRLSWGPAFEATAPLTIWEPNKRYRSEHTSPSGNPVTVEFSIEARGGKTLVRMTQSGFAAASEWEDEYWDSTNYGWGFMFFNLREYLERHAGQARLVAWPRVQAEMAREAIYEKLVGPGGIFAEGALGKLREGGTYSLRTATGEVWSGRVAFIMPPRGFCVTIESLNGALAWLTVEGAGGTFEAQLWFSTYGLPQQRVTHLESHWNAEFQRIFGKPAAN